MVVEVKLRENIQPGDIIFVKTPNVFYDAMRKLYNTEHDHTLVVVDEERCLHITYPKAKLVPIQPFLLLKRDPLVVRVTLSSKQRQQFISDIKHASVGKKYDSQRLVEYLRISILEKLGVQANLFGSTVMANVRKLGQKLPLPAKGATDSKTSESDKFIVLEASKAEDETS